MMMLSRHFRSPAGASSALLALLSLGVLLALMGGVSPWLSFPLSLPWRGFHLPFGDVADSAPSVMLFSVGTLFLVAVLGAVCALLSGRFGACTIALLAAYAALLYVPVQVLFLDPQHVLTYIDDSAQRSALQRFLNAYFWANKDVEPTLAYITEFEHFDDRLVLGWHIIAWGWVIAAMGTLLLAFLVYRLLASQVMRRLFLTGLVLVSVVHPLLFGTRPIYADYLHRQADQQLGEGRYAEALQHYAGSLKHDPVLRHSQPFLLKVSRSFYQMNGNQDLYAQIYIADADIGQRQYDAAEVRLLLLNAESMQPTPFRDAVLMLALRQRAHANLALGLVQYKDLDFSAAGSAFERALRARPDRIDAQFYLARVRFEMRQFPLSASIVEGLISRIDSLAIKADFYSTLGDAYMANGDLRAGREAYFTAYKIDKRGNYRAVKALSGT